MAKRSLRYRLYESTNIWPGFVDVLATLLMVIIFLLMVFTVSQIYLSDAISGRDKALDNLRNQINELSRILIIETKDKEIVLQSLEKSESELLLEKKNTIKLEFENTNNQSLLILQNENILDLGNQIENLLLELKVVANALETYEGVETSSLDIKGLGQRINKALASRIDQLKESNKQLEFSRKETTNQIEQLKESNKQLEFSRKETTNQIELVKEANDELLIVNNKLAINEEKLQNQISEYQKLTNDLIKINDSLDLEDADLIQQLDAIKNKNLKLANLNKNLINRDKTIFNLRGKIKELNNILSFNADTKSSQENKISLLNKQILDLNENKQNLQIFNQKLDDEARDNSIKTLEEINILSKEIDSLKSEINILNSALDASEQKVLTKELKIEVLGVRLNTALTSKIFELQKYRSEFFGKLKNILGEREDIKVVGDRFIFESELLFDSGSASLRKEGKSKLKEIGQTLKETTTQIPDDIDWIIQVEGHTDKRPINTLQYPSNWELSSARANSVLKLLLDIGFAPKRLSAAGYGEFYPISEGESSIDLQQNRRIELKLTSR